MNFKKKLMVFLAAGIMALSVSPFALAATPRPADNTVTEQADAAAGQAPAAQTQTSTMEFTNSKYLTKGGAVFWFIFIALLNGAFSFWVGNRFYRMSKKDNHIASEIRALRRDVEEKFAKNIGGFAEQEVDIENNNESLAMTEEGIKPVEKNIMRDATPEEEERFRRWAEAQSRPKAERTTAKSSVRTELQENMDDVKKIKKKNYQPKREPVRETGDEDFDSAEDLGETRVISTKGNAVKNKTKEILNDIFPFKED